MIIQPTYASHTEPRKLPRAQTPMSKMGLRFEQNVARNLTAHRPPNTTITRNPWFEYLAGASTDLQYCCPDILVESETFPDFLIVIEIKRTWTRLAQAKLRELYVPVISLATGRPVKPLVIVNLMTPEAPMPQPTISFALSTSDPLIQFLGRAPIRWT